MAKIKISNMGSEIVRLMEEYADDVAEDMKAEAKTVAKQAAKKLKSISPEGKGSRKGHYKDGWGVKVEGESSTSIETRVYNKKKPGLTHLLEKGYAKRGGGRVNGTPHISVVEKKATADYEKRLKERLSR